MTETAATTNPSDESLSFAELFEQSEMHTKKEGEVVSGKIIAIQGDYAIVDIGYKSEGTIVVDEFKDVEGKLNLNVGDVVDVLIEEQEDESGTIVLSKEKADKMKVWDQISDAYERDGVVEGRIVSRVKGGLNVDIGVRAFLPGSQVDLRPVRNLEKMIGVVSQFKILKFNKRRGNIVLSRRALLEKEREALRKNTLERLKEGAVLDGIVKNITDYGAFIDLGGIDGLLHITDMSWGRVNHPSEMFEIGDEVQTIVLKYDEERQRVSLGLKQITPDPWQEVPAKYAVGQKVEGKVVSLTDYGAFVELMEGIEGLIHVSEMSWTKKIKHPSKVLAVGDVIEAIVLDINIENRRISLGLKQLEPNPWDVIEQNYPVGTHIVGKIRNITDFGVFVGIDEGIDGLIHISDISWSQRIKHPSELFKKGQEVEAIVLSIDRENERFSLGIKQLHEDPWNNVPSKYRVGDIVSGEAISITDFGVFVSLEEGVEGLVHISELSAKKVENPEEVVKVGEKVTAEIINIDTKERRIRLSIRAIADNEEKAQYADYVQKQGSTKSSMADLIAAATSKTQDEPAESAEAETVEEAEEAPVADAAEDETPSEEAASEEADAEETAEDAGDDEADADSDDDEKTEA
ncbi:MAG: 30S ribosomal protein S1 [Deltaproteobacteria bacterium]|nr:30S ribosomal protein S1 [Deltaproteobacteria bacterium]